MKYEGSYLLMTSWTLLLPPSLSFFRSVSPRVGKNEWAVFVRQTHFCPSLHLRT